MYQNVTISLELIFFTYRTLTAGNNNSKQKWYYRNDFKLFLMETLKVSATGPRYDVRRSYSKFARW